MEMREYPLSHLIGWYRAVCPTCREEFEQGNGIVHGGVFHIGRPR
jgi:hypothetical protein